MRTFTFAIALLALAACAPEKSDYQSASRCQGMGYQPGSAEYDTCVREEKSIRNMEEQRKEYERMKQQDQDWKMRRGY